MDYQTLTVQFNVSDGGKIIAITKYHAILEKPDIGLHFECGEQPVPLPVEWTDDPGYTTLAVY